MNLDTSTTNPFHVIVQDLGIGWRKVTLEYLNWVHELLKPHGIPLETYGDTFRVLEYLAENGVIEIQNNDDNHLIRKRT